MRILVLNCGSSSLKYLLYDMDPERVLASGTVERIGEGKSRIIHNGPGGKLEYPERMDDHSKALRHAVRNLTSGRDGVVSDVNEIGAVGHRVVLGGERLIESALIDDKVERLIESYCPLAPLHNPANLMGIRAARGLMPGIPQVAVFDTAFHHTIPMKAYLYALPYEYYQRDRIRRYGFHGTSYRFVVQRAAELLQTPLSELNLIACHLGNGCSITAVEGGRSVDHSMGLTPLEGLVMGTRCGDIDPAIVLWLQRKFKLQPDEVDAILNKKSGLLALSGISNDVREIWMATKSGNPRARLALEIFSYRLKKYIGAYMAALGRVDAVIFTGGIGENATYIREMTCKGLEKLGIELDDDLNGRCRGIEGFINKKTSAVKLLVIPTGEGLMIARDTARIVSELDPK